jgi:6-phosphofructokinase 1
MSDIERVSHMQFAAALFVATVFLHQYLVNKKTRQTKHIESETSLEDLSPIPLKRTVSAYGDMQSSSTKMMDSESKGISSYASVVKQEQIKIKRVKGKTFLQQQTEAIKNRESNSLRGRKLEGEFIDDIFIHDIVTLRESFESYDLDNTQSNDTSNGDGNGDGDHAVIYNKVLDAGGREDYVLVDIVKKTKDKSVVPRDESIIGHSCNAFVRAGPRAKTHFNPSTVRAAIVTCGGLCPGLNNVIRELVRGLFQLYNCKSVLGIRGGYHGFNKNSGFVPFELTLDNTHSCHHQGGTILASSRGGFDLDIIISFLIINHIDQLYIIGGDGTHRGANTIAHECIKRKLNISVVGIPKTIDNDVDIIDRSFGFTTSVEAAQAAIRSAKTEAECNLPNGIGIVKLMGRSAGFIAVHATLASGDVDLCLVPEIVIELDGDKGCLPFLMKRVRENGHAVVVVAEGAGEELLGKNTVTDASGNKVLPAIGEFLKKEIIKYFKVHDMETTVKYIDPSYMIRSIPANASDSLYCMLLAQNAIHGCMAGYTAFSVGLVNNRVVYIPISKLVATSPRVMDPIGRTWERVLTMTLQPNTRPTLGEGASNEGLLLI